ncbi:MAG: hypothetical protein H6Q53_2320, partial [Deltaproteobacteria bacterium]|nr:hypothetical protein [Deltaproteobacteria bacterium]
HIPFLTFKPLDLSNIPEDLDTSYKGARVVKEGGRSHREEDRPPIFSYQGALRLYCLTMILKDMAEEWARFRIRGTVKNFEMRLPNDFNTSIARHSLCRRIELNDDPIFVYKRECNRQAFDYSRVNITDRNDFSGLAAFAIGLVFQHRSFLSRPQQWKMAIVMASKV